MHAPRSRLRTAALVALAALAPASCTPPEDASPPDSDATPNRLAHLTIDGPIPTTATSHPFGGAADTERPEDLAAAGYVEEEYLISGTASVYTWPVFGAASVRTAGAPYTTRLLVRRPAGRDDFSGRIVVEMLNPSNLFDLNIGWALHRAELVRSGDAWVGITAKPVAAETLRTFDPERYARVSWANPLSLSDPRNCEVTGSDSRETENGLVWDMHTHVAEWLRSRDPSNPFLYGAAGGDEHPVQYLYGWGYSQTGSFLFTYIQAIRPLARARLGREPFDGYLVAVTSGPRPIHQCAPSIPADDPRRVIRDAGAPVIHVMTQSDFLGYGPPRREDSDAPGDGYRHYQLAGAGHATPEELLYGPRFEDIERGGRVPPTLGCEEGPRSPFPGWSQFNAILRNLKAWVEEDRPPPPSERIRMDGDDPVFDEVGNVVGGVRSPVLDVPTSTWMGNSTGASFCRIAGHEVPFPDEWLAERYPDQAAYEAAFDARVDELVAERWLTPEDGALLKEEARRTRVR